MTHTEFARWLDLHQTLIPSVRAWLDSQPDKSLLLSEWHAVLSKVSMESTNDATRAIVAGKLDRPFPEDTPKCVRAWAAELDLEQRKATQEENRSQPTVLRAVQKLWSRHVLVAASRAFSPRRMRRIHQLSNAGCPPSVPRRAPFGRK